MPPGRVGRRVEDHHPGLRREPLGEVRRREREAAVLGERQRHGRRAGPVDHRLVDREAGVRVDDLVARVAGREHAEEQERLGAGRDDDVAPGRSSSAAVAREVRRARLAQRRDARCRAVVGLAVAQRLRAPASTMCGGVSKSGSPICRWMILRPWASSALARASTSKAVSVPRRPMLSASCMSLAPSGCRDRSASSRFCRRR